MPLGKRLSSLLFQNLIVLIFKKNVKKIFSRSTSRRLSGSKAPTAPMNCMHSTKLWGVLGNCQETGPLPPERLTGAGDWEGCRGGTEKSEALGHTLKNPCCFGFVGRLPYDRASLPKPNLSLQALDEVEKITNKQSGLLLCDCILNF